MVHLLNLLAVFHTNDETLPVSHSSKLAAHFTREMNQIWRNAELGITPALERKLDRQRSDAGMGWGGNERAEMRAEWIKRWLGVTRNPQIISK